jgi:microcystin-dependent protein
MANLTLTATWESGIYKIETTDLVVGGESGISNIGIKQLGNRTEYLKEHLDTAEGDISTLQSDVAGYGDDINDLLDTKIVDLGSNFSRGVVLLTTGSPMLIGASDFGKLTVCYPNALTTYIQFPNPNTLEIGSRFDVMIHTTDANFLAANIFVTASGSPTITGRENAVTFANGDCFAMVVKSATEYIMIPFNRRNDNDNPGKISLFATSSAPAGYVVANGAAVSRTAYARLFAHIGVSWGVGNGTTTFNLPDLRGEFLRAWDNSRGVDSGRVFGTLQMDAIKEHAHYLSQNLNATTFQTYGGSGSLGIGGTVGGATAGTTNAMVSGASAVETRPRNIALLACIKF